MKKLQRNDLCRCGSGKKYKHCCLPHQAMESVEKNASAVSPTQPISQQMEGGIALHRQAKLDEAKQIYQAVLQRQPDHADALHLSGLIEHQRANFSEATRLIRASLQSHEANPYAHNNLGVALRESGQHQTALQSFQRAIVLKKDYAEAYSNAGNVHKDLGQFEQSKNYYEQALKFNPQLAEAWNNLSLAYQKLKNLELAMRCSERAVSLLPDSAEVHNNLGNIYRDAGETTKALASFRTALALDPAQGNAAHFINVLSGQDSSQAPVAYVQKVFDDYAERFDQHLQEVLEYSIPSSMALELQHYFAGTPWRILDLGCGTGLVAKEMARFSAQLVGVDLSEKMLRKAQTRQLYHRLIQSDLVGMMQAEQAESYDVVTAADVFVYIGDLQRIVSETARLLPAGGLFAFSAETFETSAPVQMGQAYRLQASGRFAHHTGYIQELAHLHGFEQLKQIPKTIRMENYQAIPGHLFIFRKNGMLKGS